MPEGITESLEERLGCEVCRLYDPVHLIAQGGVEDTRVVSADDEIDVGSDEAVYGVQVGTGHAAEAQVRAGAGLDYGTDAGDLLQCVGLPPPHLFEAVVVVGAM